MLGPVRFNLYEIRVDKKSLSLEIRIKNFSALPMLEMFSALI